MTVIDGESGLDPVANARRTGDLGERDEFVVTRDLCARVCTRVRVCMYVRARACMYRISRVRMI